MKRCRFTPAHQLLAVRSADFWKSYWNTAEFNDYLHYISTLVDSIKNAGAARIFLIHEDRAHFLAGFLAGLYAGVPVVLPPSDAPELLTDLMLPGDFLLNNHQQIRNNDTSTLIKFAPLDPRHAKVIFYTSGSTGQPKAVEKKLSQLEAEVEVLHTFFGEETQKSDLTFPQETFLSTVSHHHLYALLYSLLWPVCAGFKLERHTFTYWGDLLKKSKTGDFLISSPAHLGRFSVLEECNPESFRYAFSSGAPLSYESAVQSKKYLSVWPIEVYGSTETGGIAFRQQEQPSTPWKRFDCVELSTSQDRRLQVKSPYIDDIDFYQTEDQITWIDTETFHLLGRTDRVVKVEGKRTSLTEIESKLCKCEFVAEAAVIVLEKSYREELGAVIVLSKQGVEQLNTVGKAVLKRQLREVLSLYFHAVVIPRKWRFIEVIPTNAQGKRLDSHLKRYFTQDEKSILGPVRQPIVLRKNVAENSAEYSLKIPNNLAYFEGHFKGMPLVPGVVQLNWVVEFAKTDLGLQGSVSKGDQIKFTNFMKPDDEVSLCLKYNIEKSSLSYNYKANERSYSSGRLTFTIAKIEASNGL